MKTMTNNKNGNGISREQRDAFGLLSIGLFLENFDLALHVHMVVLLNEIFLPEGMSPLIRSFCVSGSLVLTHSLQPFGALFFGRLGDTIGRKSSIVLTSIMMSVCCLTIAALPPYKKIGIVAPIVFVLCRMIQSVSARAEITGTQLYLTESTRPPIRNFIVASSFIMTGFGGLTSIGIAAIFTNTHIFPAGFIDHAWRLAFLFGSVIGIIGSVARKGITEATEFVSAKESFLSEVSNPAEAATPPLRTSLAYFCICAGLPFCMYFSYVYIPQILRSTFAFSLNQVISQSFRVGILELCGTTLWVFLAIKIAPLKIIKAKMIFFSAAILLFPFAMDYSASPLTMFFFQAAIPMFAISAVPAFAVFFSHFAVLKRFTYLGFINSCAWIVSYAVSSFGLPFFTHRFSYKGSLIIALPTAIAFMWGLMHFDSLEKAKLGCSKN